MTTIASTGASRLQPNTVSTPIPTSRKAEDSLSAANGTLRFSGERRAPASGRSTPASSAHGTASTQKRSTSGGSQPPKKRRRRKKKNVRLLLIAIGFLIFAVGVLITAIVLSGNCGKSVPDPNLPDGSETPPALETPVPVTDDTVITHSATIADVSVRNLSVQDARKRVEAALSDKANLLDITVSYESYEPLTLNAETIGLSYDEAALEAALESVARGTETNVQIPLTFDHELLRNALYTLNEKIPNHASNASATVKYKTHKIDDVVYYQPYWSFTDGVSGAKIDFDALEQQVSDAIAAGEFTASLTPSVALSEPEITTQSLRNQLTKLSSYQTNYSFKDSSKNPESDAMSRARDTNISKAVGMMQVVKLDPGQSFYFNKTTGERSEKKGWAMANAVYQGKGYRKEPGGGVCQVSTTIFNAVLRAGITNINRKGHSIPSDYVTKKFEDGLGFDATVDYGNIEFKFKNDKSYTIYMFVYITKNNSRRKNINVEIYGQKEAGVEYRVYNEILEMTPYEDESKYQFEYDKTMLSTAKRVLLNTPHNGYVVKTYVDEYKDGKFVKTIRTEETTYKPIYPIYRVGTAVVTPVPTKTPKATATPKPAATPEPADPPSEGGE